jgi:uncharacterized protein
MAVFFAASFIVQYVIRAYWGVTAGTVVLATMVPTVLMAATALLFTWVRGHGPRSDLKLGWSWRDVGLGLAFGAGGLALVLPASIVYIALFGPETTSSVGEAFGDLRAGPALAVTVLILVVFVAPFCEEVVYRGLLWGAVEKLSGRRWVAFAVTTLLFALAHFEYPRVYLLLVITIPIALVRVYTGRLLASIIVHQFNNLLPGIMLMLVLLGYVPLA